MLFAALGVVGLLVTATVRVSQTVAPEGWSTSEAVVFERATSTLGGRQLLWTTGEGEPVTRPCPTCDGKVGDHRPIAYDPTQPEEFRPLETDRMWLVGVLGGAAVALILAALVGWSMPPEPELRVVPAHRRRAIL